jgi:hypothetical protein
LAHDLFGLGVVQCGEGLVGELAKQVFVAVDFKGGHGLDGLDWMRLVAIHLFDI